MVLPKCCRPDAAPAGALHLRLGSMMITRYEKEGRRIVEELLKSRQESAASLLQSRARSKLLSSRSSLLENGAVAGAS